MDLQNYSSDSATHLLNCTHCQGSSIKYYRMKCIVLGSTKSGKTKVVVFGERNWRDRENIKRIRYVDADRISTIKA